MAKRQYAIPVPYTTSAADGAKIEMALGMPEVQAALPRIRPEIVEKLKRVGVFHHETFSRAELDSIPGDLWSKLAPHLG
jgi:hypothetical protein